MRTKGPLCFWSVPGTAVLFAGAATIALNFSTGFSQASKSTQNTGVAITVAGGTMVLASIPFFIESGRNKGRAILSLSKRNVAVGSSASGIFNYTALSLMIQF